MQPRNGINVNAHGWLGFELGVLRRLKFRSCALALTGEPQLGLALKRWNVRVSANDPAHWAWTKSIAFIENNSERLSEPEIDKLLDDAYVPRNYFNNQALASWFNETDAWWFDNVRTNAELLESPRQRALALTLGMLTGDYVFSFNQETRELRQPLSLPDVFRRLWMTLPAPVDNQQRNQSSNREIRDFLAERQDDLLFLRLPHDGNAEDTRIGRVLAWREEWVRQGRSFWSQFARDRAGNFGSHVETKDQYLNQLEDVLRTAAHLPVWAIEAVSNGFVSTDELVECVRSLRKVEAVFTKDFSELLGVRAVIITATA
jgi:hypothetical protein